MNSVSSILPQKERLDRLESSVNDGQKVCGLSILEVRIPFLDQGVLFYGIRNRTINL